MFEEFGNFTLFAQTSGWVVFFIVVSVLVVPMMVGSFAAKVLRLKDLGFKMGIILLAVVLGLCPFVYHASVDVDGEGKDWKKAFRLGIDLAGGTNLVYQVDTQAAAEAGKNVKLSMDQMIGAITRRINPSGTEEVTVRQVGSDRIEVIIPGADEAVVAAMKRQIVRLGSLEFGILANGRDHKSIIENAGKLADDERNYFDSRENRIVAIWRDVAERADIGEYFEVAFRTVENKAGEEIQQVLVIDSREQYKVTGKYLVRAYETVDERGRLAIGFTFNSEGGHLFFKLTSENRPLKDDFKRRLAILLDNQVHSAPSLITTISRQGQITGDFDKQEVNDMISVLNAGALEIPLKSDPISEFSISPTLGADVQRKGTTAIALAALTVVVFMLAYYLLAGCVADFCLVLNLVLVMGTMSLIDAAFTLPGLAGLVLTIGMAVDANVLIFERIREEQNRGSSLRMAIHNGFARAFQTIVDANVTTLIVAVVLFVIGTDQIRGFAVTLFIGIVMSMFTALYVGRLVFDIFERKRWITGKVKMFSIVGATHWDFIGKRGIAAACSIVLILAGMGTLYARGTANLDIDFRGGSMVTFEFVEEQPLKEVRADLAEQLGTSITLERLTVSETASESELGTQPKSGKSEIVDPVKRCRLRTTEQKVKKVRAAVADAFQESGRELKRVEMQFGPIAQLDAPTEEKKDETDNDQEDSEDKQDTESTPATRVTGFEGGHRVQLTFTGEVSDLLIGEGLTNALAETTGDDKYPDPASLFQVTGTQGTGVDAGQHEVKKYSEMTLLARANLEQSDLQNALVKMQATMASSPNFEEVNNFAKSVGREMQQDAILAILISLVAIVAYIWFRFKVIVFGLAAVAALVHDVLVVLGLVALASYVSGSGFGSALLLYDFKINLPMIAAFLTIIGYSLNDTIVVFDRIREVRGKNPAMTSEIINTSLNQTLARTLLTSFTTFIVVSILYAFGGEGIHGFAFCLVLGVLVGTYSSIYVASPVLLWLMNRGGSTAGQSTRSVAKAAAAT